MSLSPGPPAGVRPLAGCLLVALALLLSAGCSLAGGTLGGREKCWPESDPRAPSIWRGILDIDDSGGRLLTPVGDVIPLIGGTLRPQVSAGGVGQLLRGRDVVADHGDDVTLFGGMGGDGDLVVCAVEEKHSS